MPQVVHSIPTNCKELCYVNCIDQLMHWQCKARSIKKYAPSALHGQLLYTSFINEVDINATLFPISFADCTSSLNACVATALSCTMHCLAPKVHIRWHKLCWLQRCTCCVNSVNKDCSDACPKGCYQELCCAISKADSKEDALALISTWLIKETLLLIASAPG